MQENPNPNAAAVDARAVAPSPERVSKVRGKLYQWLKDNEDLIPNLPSEEDIWAKLQNENRLKKLYSQLADPESALHRPELPSYDEFKQKLGYSLQPDESADKKVERLGTTIETVSPYDGLSEKELEQLLEGNAFYQKWARGMADGVGSDADWYRQRADESVSTSMLLSRDLKRQRERTIPQAAIPGLIPEPRMVGEHVHFYAYEDDGQMHAYSMPAKKWNEPIANEQASSVPSGVLTPKLKYAKYRDEANADILNAMGNLNFAQGSAVDLPARMGRSLLSSLGDVVVGAERLYAAGANALADADEAMFGKSGSSRAAREIVDYINKNKTWLQSADTWFKDTAKLLPVNPLLENSDVYRAGSTIASALGSFGAQMAGGQAISRAMAVGRTAATRSNAVGLAAATFLMALEPSYRRAVEDLRRQGRFKDMGSANYYALASATAQGLLERLPVGSTRAMQALAKSTPARNAILRAGQRMMQRFDSRLGELGRAAEAGMDANRLSRGLESALEEAIMEGFQQESDNIIAEWVVSTPRKELEGVAESMIGGGGVGFVLGSLRRSAAAARRQEDRREIFRAISDLQAVVDKDQLETRYAAEGLPLDALELGDIRRLRDTENSLLEQRFDERYATDSGYRAAIDTRLAETRNSLKVLFGGLSNEVSRLYSFVASDDFSRILPSQQRQVLDRLEAYRSGRRRLDGTEVAAAPLPTQQESALPTPLTPAENAALTTPADQGQQAAQLPPDISPEDLVAIEDLGGADFTPGVLPEGDGRTPTAPDSPAQQGGQQQTGQPNSREADLQAEIERLRAELEAARGGQGQTAAAAQPTSDTPAPTVAQPGDTQSAAEPAGAPQSGVISRQGDTQQVNGVTYTRQQPLANIGMAKSGSPVTLFFGDQKVDARYAVIEASALQPSHLSGQPNPAYFLAAQPRDRSSESLRTQPRTIAGKLEPERITFGQEPFNAGAPVVNSRGEVIQGNGRADALLEYYKIGGDPRGYRQYLIDNAATIGVPQEQIEGMQAPVLVRMVEAEDAVANQLGQVTGRTMEAAMSDIDDTKSRAARLSDRDRSELVRSLSSVFDGDDVSTLRDAIRKLWPETIRRMVRAGVITDSEALLWTPSGNPSRDGLDKVEQVILQLAFAGAPTDTANLLNSDQFPDKARKAIYSVLFDMLRLPRDKQLMPAVHASIIGYMRFSRSGVESFDAWLVQKDLLTGGEAPMEFFSPLQIKMMALYGRAATKTGTIRDVQQPFRAYQMAVTGDPNPSIEFPDGQPGASVEVAVQRAFKTPVSKSDLYETPQVTPEGQQGQVDQAPGEGPRPDGRPGDERTTAAQAAREGFAAVSPEEAAVNMNRVPRPPVEMTSFDKVKWYKKHVNKMPTHSWQAAFDHLLGPLVGQQFSWLAEALTDRGVHLSKINYSKGSGNVASFVRPTSVDSPGAITIPIKKSLADAAEQDGEAGVASTIVHEAIHALIHYERRVRRNSVDAMERELGLMRNALQREFVQILDTGVMPSSGREITQEERNIIKHLQKVFRQSIEEVITYPLTDARVANLLSQLQAMPSEQAQQTGVRTVWDWLVGWISRLAKIQNNAQYSRLDQLKDILNRHLQQAAKAIPDSRAESIPISSKADVFRAMTNIFGLDAQQADAVASVYDSVAETWAKKNATTKDQWYTTRIGSIRRGIIYDDTFLRRDPGTPVNALFQSTETGASQVVYDQVASAILDLPTQMTSSAWMSALERKLGKQNMRWTGLSLLLERQPSNASVTRTDLLDYLSSSNMELLELIATPGEEAATLKGGTNYREFALSLSDIGVPRIAMTSGRTEENNLIARFATTERMLPGGTRALMIDDLMVQPGTSPAPRRYSGWEEFAVSRLAQFAASSGYEALLVPADIPMMPDPSANPASALRQTRQALDRVAKALGLSAAKLDLPVPSVEGLGVIAQLQNGDFAAFDISQRVHDSLNILYPGASPQDAIQLAAYEGRIEPLPETVHASRDDARAAMNAIMAQRPPTVATFAIKLTSDKELVRHGAMMFQMRGGHKRGAVQFAADGKAIIAALAMPDISTPLHELAHVFESELTDADRRVFTTQDSAVFTLRDSERFAMGFERYLAEGRAPTKEQQAVFDKLKEWMRDVIGSAPVTITDQMRDVYGKILGARAASEVGMTVDPSQVQDPIQRQLADATDLELEPFAQAVALHSMAMPDSDKPLGDGIVDYDELSSAQQGSLPFDSQVEEDAARRISGRADAVDVRRGESLREILLNLPMRAFQSTKSLMGLIGHLDRIKKWPEYARQFHRRVLELQRRQKSFDYSQVPAEAFTADRTPLRLTQEQRADFALLVNDGLGRTLSGEVPISIVTTEGEYDVEVQLAVQTMVAKAANRTKTPLNLRVMRTRSGKVYHVLYDAGKIRRGLDNLGLSTLNIEHAVKRMVANLELDPVFMSSRANIDFSFKQLGGKPLDTEVKQRERSRQQAEQLSQQMSDLARSLAGRATQPIDVNAETLQQSLAASNRIPTVGRLLNYSTQAHITRAVRFARNYVATGAQLGLTSPNAVVRGIADTLSGFGKNLVRSVELTRAKDVSLVGMTNKYRELAFKLDRELRSLVGNDPLRLMRVHLAMDPETYTAMLDENGSLSRELWESTMRTMTGVQGSKDFELLTPQQADTLFAEWQSALRLIKSTGQASGLIQLTPDEQLLADSLRLVNDWVHEVSYGYFGLPTDVYLRYKDRYIARMYLNAETQNEVNRLFEGTYGQLYTGMFSGRKEITPAMQMTAIKDPIYLTMQRVRQMGHNLAVQAYAQYIESTFPEAVSAEPRAGYTRLGDGSKVGNYGVLTGKYVVNEIARDLKAMEFSNAAAQKAMDFLRELAAPTDASGEEKSWRGLGAYTKLRTLYVKTFTSLNPGITLGNFIQNVNAANMAGVNPIELFSRAVAFGVERRDYSYNYERAIELRVVTSRRTQADMMAMATTVQTPERIAEGAGPTEPLYRGWELAEQAFRRAAQQGDFGAFFEAAGTAAQEFYSDIDEAAKYAAWRSLMDQGFSDLEAAQVVRESFLYFDEVGRYWQMASITPTLSPFSRVAPELLRQQTNLLTLFPMTSALHLGLLYGTAVGLSYASGEDEEDRRLRETRSGAAFYPLQVFTLGALPNVPLSWKFGNKEMNVARFATPFYLFSRDYASTTVEQMQEIAFKSFPAPVLLYLANEGVRQLGGEAFDLTRGVVPAYGITPYDFYASPEGAAAINLAAMNQDPVLTFINLAALDTDRFGRSISDPQATRYDQAPRASGQERVFNSLYFLARNYVPYGAYFDDLLSAYRGSPDSFGRTKSVMDVLLRFTTGAKLQTYDEQSYNQVVLQQLSRGLQKLDSSDRAMKAEISRAIEQQEAYRDRDNNLVFFAMDGRDKLIARVRQHLAQQAEATKDILEVTRHFRRRQQSIMSYRLQASRLQDLGRRYGRRADQLLLRDPVEFERQLIEALDKELDSGRLRIDR